jgi:catechol 2,3-dioxygenase
VFCYFLGPEDMPIEYTAEMQQVDDSYRTGKPEDWTWPPGRLDHWGLMKGPSERIETAGLKINFTADGWRLDAWK